MKNQIINVVSIGLKIWGIISLVGVLVICIFTVLSIRDCKNRKWTIQADAATADSIKPYFNMANIGMGHLKKAVHSSVSPNSITGEHCRYYLVEIDSLSSAIYQGTDTGIAWLQGPLTDTLLVLALESAFGVGKTALAWLPKAEEVNSKKHYFYFNHIEYHGLSGNSFPIPGAIILFAYDSNSNKLYIVDLAF